MSSEEAEGQDPAFKGTIHRKANSLYLVTLKTTMTRTDITGPSVRPLG